jgi:hypothetical protein
MKAVAIYIFSFVSVLCGLYVYGDKFPLFGLRPAAAYGPRCVFLCLAPLPVFRTQASLPPVLFSVPSSILAFCIQFKQICSISSTALDMNSTGPFPAAQSSAKDRSAPSLRRSCEACRASKGRCCPSKDEMSRCQRSITVNKTLILLD